MRVLVRSVYSFLLRLHPEPFRAEFGEEMFWIFTQQTQSDSCGVAYLLLCAQLMLDALRSAVVQRVFREHTAEISGMQFLTDLSDPMSRFVEGGFIAFSCSFNVLCMSLILAALLSSR